MQSADGANNVKLRGVLHVDGRALLSEDDTIVDDQFLLRRVRPIVEGTVGGIYDFRFTPDFAQGRTVIQDAYVTGRFAPGFQLTARQVQGTHRPRAPAVRQRHPVRRACVPDATRNEPRHRSAGRRQPARRPPRVPGRVPERLERRTQLRGLLGRRGQRRQGVGWKDLRAAVRELRQLRAARLGIRRRGQLYEPGGQRHADAAAAVPYAGAVDVLQVPLGCGRDW